MTATRTKADEIASVVTTPLPEATTTVSVAVVHRSRQHRGAIVSRIERADDLELVAEVERGDDALAELSRVMPDVAVVEVEALGAEGLADLVARLPAVAVVAVADDDGPVLGRAVLDGAVSTSTTAGGHEHLVEIMRDAHHRRSHVSRGTAAVVAEQLTAAAVPLEEAELVRDLAAGRTAEQVADSENLARSDVAGRLARALERVRRAA